MAMELPQVKWECLSCNTIHGTETLADECCYLDYWPDSKLFSCTICYAKHDTREYAESCCERVSTVYICPTCTRICYSEWLALFCCPSDNEVLKGIRCDPLLLESFGQLRLF